MYICYTMFSEQRNFEESEKQYRRQDLIFSFTSPLLLKLKYICWKEMKIPYQKIIFKKNSELFKTYLEKIIYDDLQLEVLFNVSIFYCSKNYI